MGAKAEQVSNAIRMLLANGTIIIIYIAGHQLFMKEASINISRDDVESSICNDELQGIFLEEEVRELRNRLTIERTKSKRLMKVIEKKVLERQRR